MHIATSIQNGLKNICKMLKNNNSGKTFRVRRGRVDSVDLYEVKENELEILENGEQANIQLNFSIFLLSIAFSGFLTLCTATFSESILQNTFLFVTIIGIIGGLYLLFMWWKGRKSIKMVIKTIKNRLQQDYVDEGDDEIEAVNEKKITTVSSNDIIKPAG